MLFQAHMKYLKLIRDTERERERERAQV